MNITKRTSTHCNMQDTRRYPVTIKWELSVKKHCLLRHKIWKTPLSLGGCSKIKLSSPFPSYSHLVGVAHMHNGWKRYNEPFHWLWKAVAIFWDKIMYFISFQRKPMFYTAFILNVFHQAFVNIYIRDEVFARKNASVVVARLLPYLMYDLLFYTKPKKVCIFFELSRIFFT